VTFRPISSSYFKNFCRNLFFEISPTSGMPRQQTIPLNITLCPTLVCCHLVKQQRRLSQLASPNRKCGCKRIFGIEIPIIFHRRLNIFHSIDKMRCQRFQSDWFALAWSSISSCLPTWTLYPETTSSDKKNRDLSDCMITMLCIYVLLPALQVRLSRLYTDHLYFYKIRRVLVAMWKKTRRSIFPTHFNFCTKHRFQAWCWQWNRPSL